MVSEGGIVIIEGCYSIRKELKDFYDYRIWIQTSKSIRLKRGIDRDGEEARHLWEEQWMPAEDIYFEIQKPLDYADMVIDGTGLVVNIEDQKIKIINE
jgi:uridine kinase